MTAVSNPRKRAVVVRHEEMVALGNFGPVLRDRGYEIVFVDAWSESFADDLAAVADAELLVVLGSARGVYEAAEHPFISTEIAFLRERLARTAPTLGVCFGAQIIAAALGSEVRRGSRVDVVLYAVNDTSEAADKSVDQRLIDLAAELNVRVLTTDYNLNKVATVHKAR